MPYKLVEIKVLLSHGAQIERFIRILQPWFQLFFHGCGPLCPLTRVP